MNINKEKWKNVEFGDVVSHYEKNEKDPLKRTKAKYVSVEHLKTLNLKIQGWAAEEQPTFFRTFKKGHILFAKRRAYQKKVAVANFDGICSPHLWALETDGRLQQELLPFLMQMDKFYEYVNANSAGTMSTYLKWSALSKYKFKLPSHQDQKQILELFLTLERYIEQIKEQKENLNYLISSLKSNLVSKSIKFGNLLVNCNFEKLQLGQFTKEVKQSTKKPLEKGIQRYIGLEHIESGNLKITRWGNVADGTTFTKTFLPGDVLFGRRRAYLKKVAIANFRGICSSDILVLRPDSKLILPNLFPYYISSDNFFNYAISTSAGSLSPRTKWKDLSKFEFHLPTLDKQAVVLKVFQMIQSYLEKSLEQYWTLKKLKHKLLDEILG